MHVFKISYPLPLVSKASFIGIGIKSIFYCFIVMLVSRVFIGIKSNIIFKKFLLVSRATLFLKTCFFKLDIKSMFISLV